MTIARTLAEFAAGPVAPDARMQRFVGLSLFDWASVGLAGTGEPVAQAARAMALDGAASHGATLLGGGHAPTAQAALVNGATSHALDYDDTHFGHIGHPSVAVIPAALAIAETRPGEEGDLGTALAVGLEVACRVGAWLGRSHYEAGFHQTGTSGAFGATAAAGRILRLDPARMAQALCLTATRAAGLKSQFGTMGKPLNAGFAAEVGVTSALLAQAGATSAPDAIEGTQGFGPTHAGSMEVSALDGLGDAWIFQGISYKFHACCHGLHAMLEALRTIRDAGVSAADVESVTIHTHPRWLAVCNQPAPVTGLQSKFSYRLTAAMMLSGVDTAALDSYTDATCARPELCALRDRVRVEADERLSDSAAEVSVVASGRTHAARYDILTPIDPARIERRLRDKSAILLGEAEAETLWRSVTRIDEAEGVTQLMTCLGARIGRPLAKHG